MSEWKCTGEVRWIFREERMNQEGPFFNHVQVKVLQQLWVKSTYGYGHQGGGGQSLPMNMGFGGDIPLGEQQQEWRDVPITCSESTPVLKAGDNKDVNKRLDRALVTIKNQMDEIAKLREQLRRYKAAVARVRKLPTRGEPARLWSKRTMYASDVLAALRLQEPGA